MYQAKFNPQLTLKPQDMLVLLRLSVCDGKLPTYAQLATELCLTASETHAAVARSIQAKLIFKTPEGRPSVAHASLLEFICHGAAYVFPVVTAGIVKGMPTAHAAPPLNELLTGAKPPKDFADWLPVWPDPLGKIKGMGVYPLYPTVPQAAKKSPMLYELLALFDAIRLGQERDRLLAIDTLRLCWQ